MTMKGTIKIHNLKQFTAPLKQMSTSFNSVVFTKLEDTLMVNAATADVSQIANIRFTNKIVQITDGEETIDKLGIFDLNQFLTALSIIESNTVEITVDNNVLVIKINDKSNLSYLLSDLNLIKEGPAELKKSPEFGTVIEINNSFIKKVRSISNNIKGSILRLIGKNGKFIYTIGDRNNHSHSFSETLLESGVTEDFETLLSISDDKRENFSILFDGISYRMSIHPRLIMLEGITEDYQMIRYFLSPLKENN